MADPTATHLPPHSDRAEQAVLGAVLLDRDAIVPLYDLLDPGDFFAVAHQRIFRAMCRLFARRVPADLVTLAEELEREGYLDEVGGDAYLCELITATPTSLHGVFYADIVKDCALRRALIAAGNRQVQLAWDARTPVAPLAARVRRPVLRNPPMPA